MRKKLSLSQLNRLEIEEFRAIEKIPIVLIADNIRSAMNVGSFFRTADAFAISKIYLTGISAKPPHKEITKTAIGSTASVAWEYYENIEEIIIELANQSFTIVSIEQTNDSISLNDFVVNPTEKYAIVLGNEVKGVTDSVVKKSNFCVEIAQFGTKHSLNVSVCAGIVLWHLVSQFNK